MDSSLLLILLGLPILAIIPAYIAKRKGRDFIGWYLYGVFIFPVALVSSLVLDRTSVVVRERAESRLFDVGELLLFLGSGVAFFLGANAIIAHKDINAIYFLLVGIVLVRGASNLARADRTSG